MIHKHQGKKFKIRCTAEFGRVSACWTCQACSMKGTPPPCDYLDDAISAAIADLEHHQCPPEVPEGQQPSSSGAWWIIGLVAMGVVGWVLLLVLFFWVV